MTTGPRAAQSPDLAAASDIGLRHATNQDHVALDVDARGCHAIIAVADGVSSTEGAERAATLAATTTCNYLTGALGQGLPTGDDAVLELFARAFRRAHEAILDTVDEPVGAATLVAAVAAPDRLLVANIGDTRAYWFPGDGRAIRLTTDDSLAQAQIDMGVSRAEAEAGTGAHAITRWLGARATDVNPRVVTYRPRQDGWLLVCSDGLWNHVPDPPDLADLVAVLVSRAPCGGDGRPDPRWVAEELVRHANACGGHDNVTVALWRGEGIAASVGQ